MIDQVHLEQIYLAIYKQYESTVFDLPGKHQKSCLRLLNAANMLYNNALRILRKQSSLIIELNSNQPISLNQNNDILFQLFQIISNSSSLPKTLIHTRKLFKNLSPYLLNYSNVNVGEFVALCLDMNS